MHRFECKVEALPLTAGVSPHRPIAEGVDSILFGKPRQARVAITMRQRAKRIEEAKRLATGHLGVERSILLRVASLCAKARAVATRIETQNLCIARVRSGGPVEDLEERTLTGAIGADERDELAERDGEPNPVECQDPRAEGLHKSMGAYGRHRY